MALWQSGDHIYCAVAAVAGVLTLAYLLIMQRKVFFGILPESLERVREAPGEVVIAAVMLSAVTVGVGIFFPAVFCRFAEPIMALLAK